MAATGEAADAGYTLDAFTNVNTSLGRKLEKPTGKTGQLVYNATTNTWDAAPALAIGTDANGNPTIDATSGTGSTGNPTSSAVNLRGGSGIDITQVTEADGSITLVITATGSTTGGTTPATYVAGADVSGTEKLSAAQASLQSGWDGTTGATDVETPAGGPFVIDATTDVLQVMAGVGTAGGLKITPGKQYRISLALSGSGTVQAYTSWMTSAWTFLAEDNYTTSTSGATKLQFTATAPATAELVSLYVKGVSGTVNILSASIKELA